MTKQSPRLEIKNTSQEWRVLKFLNQFAFLTLDSLFMKGYSRAALGRLLFGLDKPRREINYQNYKKLFSATLTRLKNKGYVSKQGSTKNAVWTVNNLGKDVLNRPDEAMVPEDDISRIFIFDIPESLKTHRDWIREKLMAAGYNLLQKSVWLGKRPLSKSFLQELINKDLFQYIHFFEVQERGTLENLRRISNG